MADASLNTPSLQPVMYLFSYLKAFFQLKNSKESFKISFFADKIVQNLQN